MRHCKVWNHDETEILESDPGSASSNIIFWFTQCNQSAKAPTSAKASIDQWGGLQNGSVRVSENDDFLFKNFLPFRAKVIWPAGLWKMNFLKKLTKKDSSNSLDQGSWNSFTELFVVNIVHNVWFHKCKKSTWVHLIVWATSVSQTTLQNCKLAFAPSLSLPILLQNGRYPQWRYSPTRYWNRAPKSMANKTCTHYLSRI